MVRTNSLALGLVLACGLHLGCVPEAPAPAIASHVGPRQSLLRLHRVVLVALQSDENDSAIGDEMTQALFQAVQERKLFHLRVVHRTDPEYRDLPLRARRPCTLEELAAMRKALDCNAVLLGSIQRFEPYPRMKMGLYLRLMDLRRGRLVWAVDHTWDTADRSTELRMKKFFTQRMRSGYDPVRWRLGMLSPKAFGKFVAHEVAGTLPRKEPAVPAAKRDRGPLRGTLEKIAKISNNISRTYEYLRE